MGREGVNGDDNFKLKFHETKIETEYRKEKKKVYMFFQNICKLSDLNFCIRLFFLISIQKRFNSEEIRDNWQSNVA